MRFNQYRGPAKNGAELEGELFLSVDDKCELHPTALMLEFNVGPASKFYCCSECERPLPKLSTLIGSLANNPCLEYPGTWIVNIPESLGSYWSKWWRSKKRVGLGHNFVTKRQSIDAAKSFLNYLQEMEVEFNPYNVRIMWTASHHDPRTASSTFLTSRVAGNFNAFGDFKPA